MIISKMKQVAIKVDPVELVGENTTRTKLTLVTTAVDTFISHNRDCKASQSYNLRGSFPLIIHGQNQLFARKAAGAGIIYVTEDMEVGE